jgi:S1-C subfamily serine protease
MRIMKKTLAILGLVLALSFDAMSQTAKGQAPHKSGTTKKDSQAKSLSGTELHNEARRVSVLIAERTFGEPGSGTRHLGSGVWLAEGIVATCWHVVSAAKKDQIKISLGAGDDVTDGSNTFEGVFRDYSAIVVASDPEADVAILKTEDNPFKDTGVLIRTPTMVIKPKLSVARVNENVPPAGTLTVLSGYPMSGLDLISQTGNVAGIGIPNVHTPKGVRILVSVVSNPGNSGGPVLNERGELIGLQEGNLSSPVKDESPTQAIYFRPKKDATGKLVTDAQGNPQAEMALMFQNSGISMVIPYRLIAPLLKQAQEKK